MEQLQNLVAQYAVGLRRLELEEAEEQTPAEGTASDVSQFDGAKTRGWRFLLLLQHSANRSKWMSSTECALYVRKQQQNWASHNGVPVFLSLAFHLISECQRILAGSEAILTRTSTSAQFPVMKYECRDGSTPGDGPHLTSEQQIWSTHGDGSHLATAQSCSDVPTGLRTSATRASRMLSCNVLGRSW